MPVDPENQWQEILVMAKGEPYASFGRGFPGNETPHWRATRLGIDGLLQLREQIDCVIADCRKVKEALK